MDKQLKATTLPPAVIAEVNRLLLAGEKIKDTAAKLNLTYSKVSTMRNKLVKANVLQPIIKFHRRPGKSKNNKIVTAKISTTPAVSPAIETPGKKKPTMLYINGVKISILQAREVLVSEDAVTINY